jgi:hypothetical protein
LPGIAFLKRRALSIIIDISARFYLDNFSAEAGEDAGDHGPDDCQTEIGYLYALKNFIYFLLLR